MDDRFKKLIAGILVGLVVALQGTPVATAYATQATPAESPTVIETTVALDMSGLADSDELFAGYVNREFGLTRKRLMLMAPRRSTLNEREQKVYEVLKAEIQKVASGDRSSTKIFVPFGTEYNNTSITASEAGVDKITNDNFWSCLEKYWNAEKIVRTLVLDLPYDLYWFDKTTDFSFLTKGITHNADKISLGSGAGLTFELCVSEDYQGADEYTTNTQKTKATTTAVANAQKIVSDAAAVPDWDKLRYYKEQICDLTSYNSAAATAAANDSSTPYGDPWQLVYVFDGDPNTTVVCEGYAKAFKYLCDQTTFSNPAIEAHIVTGKMTGGTGAGDHMWNVVHMDDGKNYLVDVTNCDEGTIGYPDLLFFKGATQNTEAQKYTVVCNSKDVTYEYDEDTKDSYDKAELTLPNTDYAHHDHSFTYSASGATITATCGKNGCELVDKKATLTIVAPTLATYGGEGSAEATLDGLGTFNVATGKKAKAEQIKYYKATVNGTTYTKAPGALRAAPTDAGNYVAEITVENKTARIGYTIARATARVTTAPTEKTLPYTGNAQPLVDAGVAEGGKMVYSLDGTTFGEAIPTGTAAKNYTVYYKAAGDANHTDSAIGTVTTTIAQPVSVSTVNVTGVDDWTYDGTEHTLSPVVTMDGTTLAAGTDYDVSGNVKAKNAGTYKLTIEGKGRYTGKKEVDYTVSPVKNPTLGITFEGAAPGSVPSSVIVKVDDTQLTDGTDYTVTYKDAAGNAVTKAQIEDAMANANEDAEYTAVITLKGNYEGSAEKKFTVASANKAAASAVIAKINAIGQVAYDNASKQRIDEARAAYNQLTAGQKTLVSNYGTLTAAESEYEQLQKDAEDAAAAEDVTTQINALPAASDVRTSDEASIVAAREAYGSLTDAQKNKISADTLSKLEAAEEALDARQADKAAADAVANTINALPAAEVVRTSDKAAIEAARAAYAGLTDAQKALVGNDTLQKLQDAEASLAARQADEAAAALAAGKIDAIGQVAYDDASKQRIDEARAAYNQLTSAQKALVSNYGTLTAAESGYERLKKEAEDAAAAEAVTTQINALPAAEAVQTTDKAAIEAARYAYAGLTDAQKALVGNDALRKLASAEASLAALQSNEEAVSEVVEKIAAIGDVTLSRDSQVRIGAARAAYDALSAAQKNLVTNYNKLEEAEETFAELKAQREQDEFANAISAEGYEGTYDGQAHGIQVSAPVGAIIRYGARAGSFELDKSPEYTDPGTYTVYYQVSKDGLQPVTGSAVVTINEAEPDPTPSPDPTPIPSPAPRPAPTPSHGSSRRTAAERTSAEAAKMAPSMIAMLRVYNPWSGEHLYTSDSGETATLVGLGWRDEGISWVVPTSSSTPVYRLCNPFSGDHHYTIDRGEYDKLAELGWKQEGVAFYSDDKHSVAVFRLFNPFVEQGTHHYTTDWAEYNGLPAQGWVQEGVGWYALR